MRTTAVLLATLFLGCAGETPSGTNTQSRSGTSSHVSAAVLAALDAKVPGHVGRSWNVSSDNVLAADWLIQTPPAEHFGRGYAELAMPVTCTPGPGCDADFGLKLCSRDTDCGANGRCAPLLASVKAPGESPRAMCLGHSDVLVDRMYANIVGAERWVDVTSLLPPDGRFEAALRNAVTYLGRSGRAVTVRFLFGAFPVQGVVNSKEVLGKLTRDLPASSKLNVYVGNYRSSNAPPSWNHSKIIAVDGKTAIVGGHNLWSQHYLDKNPVHDLSMSLTGSAAGDAHRFAELQWQWTCANRSWLTWSTWSVWANRWAAGKINDDCPPAYKLADVDGGGDATVLALGRLAWVDPKNASNDADLALEAMIRAARKSVKISQQDLGPPTVPVLGIPLGSWPQATLSAIGGALVRDVDVYLVMSNVGAVAGGLSATVAPYANGWSMDEIVRRVRAEMIARPSPGQPSGAALDELICRKLHVAPLRFGPDEVFPDGVTFPNHAKLVVVDDVAAYVGSQNLYDAGLTEFGYLVDDDVAAAGLVREYWSPVWAQSKRVAVSGSDAPRCTLR